MRVADSFDALKGFLW